MRAVLASAFVLSALALAACQKDQTCPRGCPTFWLDLSLPVTSASGKAVDGVTAILTGPVTKTLSCQPDGTQMETVCTWPAPVTPGSYTLQVSAPGYPTETSPATIALTRPTCNCPAISIQPSSVTLGSDAGTDAATLDATASDAAGDARGPDAR
ncbi:MAG TPA: hypothetical protein VHO06_05175 [Polyangia bacterium]|nr:hypothetical protein [Polyangia bacterium]